MEPNELKHYGVKGMKWGVRRSQEALDRAAGRRAKRRAKRQESSEKNRKREAASMSDKELKSRLNRVRMEQEYVKLTSQPTIVEKGRKNALDFLKQKGQQQFTKQFDRQLNRAVDKSIDYMIKQARG